jgi:quercetin dioxygenase-like cupin family protein
MKIDRWQAERLPTADEVLDIFKAEGFEPFIEEGKPAEEMADHRHPFDEVRMVVGGAMRYNVAGNEFLLREGDRLEIPSNTRHHTRVEPQGDCVSVVAFKVG